MQQSTKDFLNPMQIRDLKSALGTIIQILVVAALAWLQAGCTLTRDSVSLFHLPAGDEVQVTTVTTTGIHVEPIGTGGPKIVLGRERVELSRVPGFDAGTDVPDVALTSNVDVATGAITSQTLSVSE